MSLIGYERDDPRDLAAQPRPRRRAKAASTLCAEQDYANRCGSDAAALALRTDKAAHPQMRALLAPVLALFQRELPVLFGTPEAAHG